MLLSLLFVNVRPEIMCKYRFLPFIIIIENEFIITSKRWHWLQPSLY